MTRGDAHAAIFLDEEGRQAFCARLAYACERFRVAHVGVCLIDNGGFKVYMQYGQWTDSTPKYSAFERPLEHFLLRAIAFTIYRRKAYS